MRGRKHQKRKSGLTTNTTTTEVTLQSIVANVTPKVRYETLEGREHMVVPMVMITNGVHAGSNGPLYYPEEELAKTPAVWNHKPIVVYHPTMNGQAISACEKHVIESRKVGLIMNTRWTPPKKGKPGKLNSEAWLEINKLKKVDDRVLESIRNGEIMEVSTGLFTDNEDESGVWEGEDYDVVARNYRPDHLAILPDETGACSVKDGAGLLRNEASHDDIRSQLQTLVSPPLKDGTCNFGGKWVMDVFNKFCIYQDGKKLLKQDYQVGDDQKVSLVGTPQEVNRTVKYATPNGTTINTGEKPMKSKKTLVNGLIANANTHWTEDDRDTLMEMDEATLEKMSPIESETTPPAANGNRAGTAGTRAGKSKSGQVNNGGDDDDDDGDDQLAANGRAAAKPQTLEEHLATLPPEIRTVVNSAIKVEKARKDQLIALITANKSNKFSREFLATKDADELEGLAALARGNAPAANGFNGGTPRIPMFIGQGEEPANNQGSGGGESEGGDDEEALALPVMNFERKAPKVKVTAGAADDDE